jgi:zinc transport system permease protein
MSSITSIEEEDTHMIEALITYKFMQHALVSGMIIGLVAPLIGVFLVVRRMSLIADALSHITLSGVAAGLLLSQYTAVFQGVSPIYMGMVFSVGGAFLIDKLRQAYKFYQELAIPIILSAGIGLGVVLISLANGFNVDLFGYLFGSLLSVTTEDLWRVAVAGIIVLGAVWVFYKELLYLSFDEEGARLAGVPRRVVNVIFSVLVALVISVSMQVVGILLVSALITLPVAAALQLANSFRQTFVYAVIFGEFSVICGLMIAFTFNLASGGTIVLVAVLLLGLVLLLKRITGAE